MRGLRLTLAGAIVASSLVVPGSASASAGSGTIVNVGGTVYRIDVIGRKPIARIAFVSPGKPLIVKAQFQGRFKIGTVLGPGGKPESAVAIVPTRRVLPGVTIDGKLVLDRRLSPGEKIIAEVSSRRRGGTFRNIPLRPTILPIGGFRFQNTNLGCLEFRAGAQPFWTCFRWNLSGPSGLGFAGNVGSVEMLRARPGGFVRIKDYTQPGSTPGWTLWSSVQPVIELPWEMRLPSVHAVGPSSLLRDNATNTTFITLYDNRRCGSAGGQPPVLGRNSCAAEVVSNYERRTGQVTPLSTATQLEDGSAEVLDISADGQSEQSLLSLPQPDLVRSIDAARTAITGARTHERHALDDRAQNPTAFTKDMKSAMRNLLTAANAMISAVEDGEISPPGTGWRLQHFLTAGQLDLEAAKPGAATTTVIHDLVRANHIKNDWLDFLDRQERRLFLPF